jgi:Icc-related predicted phosphoesterase
VIKLKKLKVIVPILILVLTSVVLLVYLSQKPLTIASKGKSKFTIIHKDTLNDSNYAYLLKSEISKITGANLAIRTEKYANNTNDYEIVLGDVNRDNHIIDVSDLGEFGYIIEVVDKKIYIKGKTDYGTYTGIKTFLEKFTKNDKIVIGKNTYEKGDGLDMIISPIETELKIKGIKNDYTFLHVTDTHLTLFSDSDTKEVKASSYSRSQVFMTSDGIPSGERLPGFFHYAEKINADMIFLTGDIADFPTETNIEVITDNIKKCKIPSLFVLGNHDWSFEWDYHSQNTKDTYIPKYKDLSGGNIDFQVKEFEDLQIIAINNSENQVSQEQYELTKSQLENGLPTILIMHVPIYIESLAVDTISVWGRPILMGPGGVTPSDWTTQFYNLITNEDNNVQAIIAGHLHFDHEDEFLPGRMQIVTQNATEGHCRVIKISGK